MFKQIQGDDTKYRNIGDSIDIVSRVLSPGQMEVHSLFYSSVNQLQLSALQDPSKQNVRLGLLQMYHPSAYAPAPEFWINNYTAFQMPLKSYQDQMSASFSFAFWNNIIIGKAGHDNYFEIGSFCYND